MGMALLLALMGLLASYIPTRRVASVSPSVAHHECPGAMHLGTRCISK